MAHWFCNECKRARPEEQMLPGWNGVWCPNCVWNEVMPVAVSVHSSERMPAVSGPAGSAAGV